MKLNYNDGGRADAGFKGEAGDCVVRAIAIATGEPYKKIYDELAIANKHYAANFRTRVAKKIKGKSTPRNGVHKEVFKMYLKNKGWTWTPTMFIGRGCKVHLKSDELPFGRLIVSVSKHLCTVINGVLNDINDCSRQGTRCVYGYWTKKGTILREE